MPNTAKFISAADFETGILFLPTGYNSDKPQSENPTDFDDKAAKYEKEVLRCLLNDKLYSDLLADLDINNNPQTQLFIDLMDGKTFVDTTRNNNTVIFEGLREMIKYYVYYFAAKDYQNILSDTGTKTLNIDTGAQTAIRQMYSSMNDRFNEFVTRYYEAVYFIDFHYETYFPVNSDFINWFPKPQRNKGRILINQLSNYYYMPNKQLNKCFK